MERGSGHHSLMYKEGFPLAKIEQLIEGGVSPGCSISIITTSNQESRSFGYFDDSRSKRVTSHTPYDLASVSKLFTTALILRLHDLEKLSIDNPCAQYLDNFSGSRVTLRDLLTHRVDFGVQLSEYRRNYPNKEALITALMGIEPPVTQSDSVHYANLGFIFLGIVIERTAGKSLNNVMKELFQELELYKTCTGADIQALRVDAPPTEVVGNQVIQNTTHDETARILSGIAGNAGVFSSSEDLARFGKAWIDGKILRTEQLRKIAFTNYGQTGLKPQALGWRLHISTMQGEITTPDVYSHTGFTGSLLVINPQKNKVCAFTCNRTYYGRDNSKQKEAWELIADWMQT